jgi:hypothetical protein
MEEEDLSFDAVSKEMDELAEKWELGGEPPAKATGATLAPHTRYAVPQRSYLALHGRSVATVLSCSLMLAQVWWPAFLIAIFYSWQVARLNAQNRPIIEQPMLKNLIFAILMGGWLAALIVILALRGLLGWAA